MTPTDPLVVEYDDVATDARQLWAEDGYATHGYSLAQVHEALWHALRETISVLKEDAAWHASSGDDRSGLGRYFRHRLRRMQPAHPPLDDEPPPPETDEHA